MTDRLNYSSAGATRNRNQGPLIPLSGVRIHAAESPTGFIVGVYDADDLVSQPRWFRTYERAQAYAATLKS